MYKALFFLKISSYKNFFLSLFVIELDIIYSLFFIFKRYVSICSLHNSEILTLLIYPLCQFTIVSMVFFNCHFGCHCKYFSFSLFNISSEASCGWLPSWLHISTLAPYDCTINDDSSYTEQLFSLSGPKFQPPENFLGSLYNFSDNFKYPDRGSSTCCQGLVVWDFLYLKYYYFDMLVKYQELDGHQTSLHHL